MGFWFGEKGILFHSPRQKGKLCEEFGGVDQILYLGVRGYHHVLEPKPS